jgi:LmbE family N-acetylglucosaminyl deacetylase
MNPVRTNSSFSLSLERPLILVAHQDDEALGCSLLLQRSTSPVVVFATDGAPQDPYFWSKAGSRARYAAMRRLEGLLACRAMHIKEVEFLPKLTETQEFMDQRLYRSLPLASMRLQDIVDRYGPQYIVSHAYEGGHPDHDSCAFLARVLADGNQLPLWEFPLYHRNNDRYTRQEFISCSGKEIACTGSLIEMEVKANAICAYASQRDVLRDFNWSTELYRPAERYDFAKRPHGGKVNYETWGWNVSGNDVLSAFENFTGKAKVKAA